MKHAMRPAAKAAPTIADLAIVFGYTVLNAILPRKHVEQPPSVHSAVARVGKNPSSFK
jgi:hypothetical protein